MFFFNILLPYSKLCLLLQNLFGAHCEASESHCTQDEFRFISCSTQRGTLGEKVHGAHTSSSVVASVKEMINAWEISFAHVLVKAQKHKTIPRTGAGGNGRDSSPWPGLFCSYLADHCAQESFFHIATLAMPWKMQIKDSGAL